MSVTAKAGLRPGTDIVIGGESYTCPPLNFGALRRMSDIPRTASYANDLMAFIIIESLKRNYDGVDAIWLNDTLEGVELDGAGAAMLEIMKASGLKVPDEAKVTTSEQTASGEPLAAA